MAKAAKKAAPKTIKAAPKKAAAKTAVKTAKKAAAKPVKKAAAKKGGTANSGFMAPLTVSPALAEVVGNKPLPRTEIIKKIWDYIKKSDLQDSKNRRMINADDKLKAVFGGKAQVSMFELAKIVNNHVK
jgi:upstream activation factor subunit UAF30